METARMSCLMCGGETEVVGTTDDGDTRLRCTQCGAVTVGSAQALCQAIKKALSPLAVAAIAVCLGARTFDNPDVNNEVQWFGDILTDVLGGCKEEQRWMEQLGL